MSTIKKDALYGIIDQGIVSLNNLLLGLFLVNFSSKDNYGLFGIGFSIILLCIGGANALITTQMTVIAPGKGKDKNKYCFSMLITQYILFFPTWLIFQTIIFIAYRFDFTSYIFYIFLTTLGFSIVSSIFIEFMRRYFYSELQPGKVLTIDLINLVFILFGLFTILNYQKGNLHIWVIGLYGAGALISGFIGLATSKIAQFITIENIITSIKESFSNGLWALGGVFVTWLQSQGYIILLSVLATPTSIAEANAAKLFLSPIGIISTSFSRVFMPRLVRLKNNERHNELHKLANKILIIILGVIFIIVITIYLVKDTILDMFFTVEYSNIGSLIGLWALVYIFQTIRSNSSMILQIYKKFKILTLLNFITALISLVIGYILIKKIGINGSILSIASGELLLSALLWRFINAVRKDHN